MLPGSNRNNHKRRMKSNSDTDAVVFYQPSIYRYQCRGAFFASSEQSFSHGTCHGLRSRLELLSDMETNTREGAIKDFTYMTDFELDDDANANELNQQTKSILVSPALVYQEKDANGQPVKSSIPEEEIIKRQEWACYGSTEVEYLVLQNPRTGEEKIAAVAPRNMGLSVRKIESDDGSITSIALGWLNIVVDTGPPIEVEQQSAVDVVQPLEEVSPRPSSISLASAKQSVQRVYSFSQKVAEQMQQNVVWLYGNVQEDFPHRTYQAGHKIVEQIPKTVERTGRFMSKMFDRLVGDDDDDDNDT